MTSRPRTKPAGPNVARSAGLIIAAVVGGMVALTLSRCGDEETSQVAPNLTIYKSAAKELVKEHLRDPSSAEFSDLHVAAGGTRDATVCGRVNARNGVGGMTGAKRFIAGGTVVLEEEVGASSMDQLWQRFC